MVGEKEKNGLGAGDDSLTLRELISPARIAARVRELAELVNTAYAGQGEVLVVGVLNGAAIFLADLVRQLSIPLAVDFLRLASYGASTESTGVVQLRKDLEISPTDRHVLIVEDIVDTGLTLDFLLKHLAASSPKSVEICTLLDKPARRRTRLAPRFVGFPIGDEFVVGYGMDFGERYRQLPGVYVLSTTARECD